MDNKQGGGLVSLFATGLFAAACVLTPIMLIWRYGVFYFLGVMAPIITLIAFFQEELLTAFPKEEGHFGQFNFLNDFFSLPWTAVAILSWLALLLTIVIMKFGNMPTWMQGKQ